MSLADKVLAVNDDLPIRPIRTDEPVHSGKVRSVYWLTEADSTRLIAERGYDVAADAPLAIMVISDRISAFDCIWHAEGGSPARAPPSTPFPITGSAFSGSGGWLTATSWKFPIRWCGSCRRRAR
jgi:hypothetical protein